MAFDSDDETGQKFRHTNYNTKGWRDPHTHELILRGRWQKRYVGQKLAQEPHVNNHDEK
jgi:hypothetical protein